MIEDGPLYIELRDILLAWTVSRTDEGLLPYVTGVARLAGMFLINLSSNEQAYVSFRNFLERGCPRAFCGGPLGKDEVIISYFNWMNAQRCIARSILQERIFHTSVRNSYKTLQQNFRHPARRLYAERYHLNSFCVIASIDSEQFISILNNIRYLRQFICRNG